MEKSVPVSEYLDINAVYDNLSEDRKQLVQPIKNINIEKTNQWASQPFNPNPFHPENLIFKTDRGEMVRSKSECIIANMLYKRSQQLAYKYEAPLIIDGKTIYPDFTIMRKSDCEIYYLEHAGLLDDPVYANKHVEKVNEYTMAKILPGQQLIITSETSNMPLDINTINELLNYYFPEN